MGTIAQRTTADGKTRFRAQIRISRKGLPPFIKTRTFPKESLAKEWIKRIEAEGGCVGFKNGNGPTM